MEDTRARVLTKALEQYPDQKARPVWVHPQLDKLSQGWILSLDTEASLKQNSVKQSPGFSACHLLAVKQRLENPWTNMGFMLILLGIM